MSLPDPHPPTADARASVRERLRRLGATGVRARDSGLSAQPAPRIAPDPFRAGGDSVEVLRARYGPGHRHGRTVLGDALDSLAEGGEGIDLPRTVWLDTETTGLAGGTGTCAFLIGAAFFEGGALVVEQFLLRRLSAEGRLLAALRDRLRRAPHLVTFNGQRFDWPILETRFILARQQPVTFESHTDLIYPARRLWHRVLGTHRLSALEAEILGAPRADDVSGWEIPMIYVQYLRTADRAALEPVLAHNRADLLALVILHGEVVRILRDPTGASTPLDWEGAGVLLGRQGDHRQAVTCLERAARESVGPQDRWRVLRRLTREHRAGGEEPRVRMVWEAAAQKWTACDRYRVHVLEEVAKARAREGDLEGARTATGEALSLALSLCDLAGGGTPVTLSRLVERLRRRALRLAQRDREMSSGAQLSHEHPGRRPQGRRVGRVDSD